MKLKNWITGLGLLSLMVCVGDSVACSFVPSCPRTSVFFTERSQNTLIELQYIDSSVEVKLNKQNGDPVSFSLVSDALDQTRIQPETPLTIGESYELSITPDVNSTIPCVEAKVTFVVTEPIEVEFSKDDVVVSLNKERKLKDPSLSCFNESRDSYILTIDNPIPGLSYVVLNSEDVNEVVSHYRSKGVTDQKEYLELSWDVVDDTDEIEPRCYRLYAQYPNGDLSEESVEVCSMPNGGWCSTVEGGQGCSSNASTVLLIWMLSIVMFVSREGTTHNCKA